MERQVVFFVWNSTYESSRQQKDDLKKVFCWMWTKWRGKSTRNRWRGSLLFFKTFMSVPSLTNICKHTKGNTFRTVKLYFLSSNAERMKRELERVLRTLPAFSRSLLPFTLYSMWTRRSRFSWRDNRMAEMERDYPVMAKKRTDN